MCVLHMCYIAKAVCSTIYDYDGRLILNSIYWCMNKMAACSIEEQNRTKRAINSIIWTMVSTLYSYMRFAVSDDCSREVVVVAVWSLRLFLVMWKSLFIVWESNLIWVLSSQFFFRTLPIIIQLWNVATLCSDLLFSILLCNLDMRCGKLTINMRTFLLFFYFSFSFLFSYFFNVI